MYYWYQSQDTEKTHNDVCGKMAIREWWRKFLPKVDGKYYCKRVLLALLHEKYMWSKILILISYIRLLYTCTVVYR